jgi:hypothetical protein
MLRRVIGILACLVCAGAGLAPAQHSAPLRPAPLTRAERTGYRETSRYDDVMAFLREVTAGRRQLRLTTFGYSFEARALPLVVVGATDTSAEAVRSTGKVRIYLQGNIHAGEVEGKEALLMLLRDLAAGRHARWLDSLVLLVAPVLNPDGTERVTLTSRPLQYGPVGGTGQRSNAQNLDLNRDFAKLETPEVRSQVLLMRAFDPHVAMDLHTTDGSVHAYHLTYAGPLHPATDPGIVRLVREAWLPAVTRAVRERDGWESWFYGNIGGEPVDRGGGGDERGWYTYDHRVRYTANYWGLRNRLGILCESYSYAPFEERVRVTSHFLEEALDWAYRHAGAIRRAVEAADARALAGDSLAVRGTLHRGDDVEVLLGAVAEERHPYTGRRMLRRLDVRRAERMPDFTTFEGSAWERVPRAYLVPPRFGDAIERLAAHGIAVTRLAAPAVIAGERFRIDSTWTAERPFQEHRERTVVGAWEPSQPDTFPAGTAVVRTDQPLGRLAVLLLEPRSDDGLLTWNLFDGGLAGARYAPVRRTFGVVP